MSGGYCSVRICPGGFCSVGFVGGIRPGFCPEAIVRALYRGGGNWPRGFCPRPLEMLLQYAPYVKVGVSEVF